VRLILHLCCITLILLLGCSEKNTSEIKLVAIQWVGNGFEGSDRCASVYWEDGKEAKKPSEFLLSPYDAIKVAKDKLNFSCTHKFGAQIYADKENYYIARVELLDNAIIINGTTGKILSAGFQARSLPSQQHR
jgi:hypothetical protein